MHLTVSMTLCFHLTTDGVSEVSILILHIKIHATSLKKGFQITTTEFSFAAMGYFI